MEESLTKLLDSLTELSEMLGECIENKVVISEGLGKAIEHETKVIMEALKGTKQ